MLEKNIQLIDQKKKNQNLYFIFNFVDTLDLILVLITF